MNACYGAAVAYAKIGWPVLPCGLDKKPLTANGVKNATTSEKVIAEWWRMWPDAQVAIATGLPGPTVLDIDGAGGLESARKLQPAPRRGMTAVVRTARGWHLYYVGAPGVGCSVGALGPGLDVRGEGGYVIAPPSRHPSGAEYAWTRHHNGWAHGQKPQLGEWPGWRNERRREVMSDAGIIPEGKRNDRLFYIACTLRRSGLDATETMTVMRYVNQKRCVPPVDEDELRTLVESAVATERQQPAPPMNIVTMREAR